MFGPGKRPKTVKNTVAGDPAQVRCTWAHYRSLGTPEFVLRRAYFTRAPQLMALGFEEVRWMSRCWALGFWGFMP